MSQIQIVTSEISPSMSKLAMQNLLRDFEKEITRAPGESERDYNERVATSANVGIVVKMIGPFAEELMGQVPYRKGETPADHEKRVRPYLRLATAYLTASFGAAAKESFIGQFVELVDSGDYLAWPGILDHSTIELQLSSLFIELNGSVIIDPTTQSHVISICTTLLPTLKDHGQKVAKGIVESLTLNGRFSLTQKVRLANSVVKEAVKTGKMNKQLAVTVASHLNDSGLTATDLGKAVVAIGHKVPVSRYDAALTWVPAKILSAPDGEVIRLDVLPNEFALKFQVPEGMDRDSLQREIERLFSSGDDVRKFNVTTQDKQRIRAAVSLSPIDSSH